ncbi:MAG TPA: amino acid permease [Candidatus Binatia bacterium]|nr:amino acid permease [Candidatus Binatia bacterium]
MRQVNTFTAACVLISNVIGSGIFTTTGFMARDLGDPGVILVLWLVGAVLALAGALSYSELGAALPEAGGEYIYIRRAYGAFAGFLSGWTSFTIGFATAIAAAAMGFAAYLLRVLALGDETDGVATILALLLVWILTGVHVTGVGPGGFLQRLLTVLKVSAILLLVVGAFVCGNGSWENLRVVTPSVVPSFGIVFVALIFVTYTYSGWNAAAYIAGEMTDPGRSIPRSMIWGTLFVGLVYLVLNLVYFYALPVPALAQEPILPVAEKVCVALFGPAAARLVAVMLCISIASAASAMIWAGPRVYYAMARDGVFPTIFSATRGDKDGVPGKSIVLQSVWVTLLVLSGTFEQLVIYSGFALTIFSALAVGAVMVLRRRRQDLPRPYLVPLYPLPPLFYVAVSVLIAAYIVVERPIEALMAVATVFVGVPFYLLWGLRKSLAE